MENGKSRNLRHQDPFFHEVAIWPFHPPNTHSSPFYFQENDLLKLSKISHIDIFFFRFNKKLRTSQLVLFAICNDYLTVNSNCTIKCKLHLDKNWNSSSKRNWISFETSNLETRRFRLKIKETRTQKFKVSAWHFGFFHQVFCFLEINVS